MTLPPSLQALVELIASDNRLTTLQGLKIATTTLDVRGGGGKTPILLPCLTVPPIIIIVFLPCFDFQPKHHSPTSLMINL